MPSDRPYTRNILISLKRKKKKKNQPVLTKTLQKFMSAVTYRMEVICFVVFILMHRININFVLLSLIAFFSVSVCNVSDLFFTVLLFFQGLQVRINSTL